MRLTNPGALDDIIDTSAGSIPCKASNAVITVEFNGMVTDASVEGGLASYAGSEAIFEVPDLEAIPTSFSVVLDTCAEADGDQVVASASYVDDDGNTPDLDPLTAEGVISNAACDGGKAFGFGVDDFAIARG